jgi:Alkylmercury lyase
MRRELDLAGTLAAANIPASKLGPARRARLDDSERALYFWILRRFATAGRPGRAELLAEAERLGGDADRMLASLRREDLIHLGSDGEISVAYPFSGRATPHQVRFPTGHEVDAMCALDALGMAPMFGEPVEIGSRDPVTDEQIEVRLAPGGGGSWEPESAVVVAGSVEGAEDGCTGCCQVLNFFASTESAERWLTDHPGVRGEVVSIPTAIAAGRAVFGDVFAGE